MLKLEMLSRWMKYGVLALGLGFVVILSQHFYGTDDEHTSMTKWGNAPIMNEDWYDMAKEYDEVYLTPGVWENREDHQRELIARNPDILFGTYFSLHTCPYWMSRGREGTYVKKLWDFQSKHLVYTELGDTASIWKNQPIYNVLDPDVRQGSVDILAEYCRDHGVNTVFLDYATKKLIRYDQKPDGVYGELDFDQDGIIHRYDRDEQDALELAYFDYIKRMRDTLPPRTKLVVNGNLAIFNPEFGRLFAEDGGIFLEDFPYYFWARSTDPDSVKWANALNPEYPNNVHDLMTRAQVYLGDRWDRARVKSTAKELGIMYTNVE